VFGLKKTFLACLKKNYFQFNLWLQKTLGQQIFFPPPLLVLLLDPGYGMDKNQDPGSEINSPDPQHWEQVN
jgi:hypothetical protein